VAEPTQQPRILKDRHIGIPIVEDDRPAVTMDTDRRQPGTGTGLFATGAVAGGFLTQLRLQPAGDLFGAEPLHHRHAQHPAHTHHPRSTLSRRSNRSFGAGKDPAAD
jgi:hypothetical protein